MSQFSLNTNTLHKTVGLVFFSSLFNSFMELLPSSPRDKRVGLAQTCFLLLALAAGANTRNKAVSKREKRLLLMGSSAFKASELPAERQERVDQAIKQDMKIIVGEASGASRLFQDYLKAKATETRAVPLSAYSSVMHPNARFAMAPWF